jgi:hypothetical protein
MTADRKSPTIMHTAWFSGFILVLALSVTGTAQTRDAPLSATERADLQADRASNLAMAGDFEVTFDMHETTCWRADYTPIAPRSPRVTRACA